MIKNTTKESSLKSFFCNTLLGGSAETAITDQEKAGQNELIKSQQLPVNPGGSPFKNEEELKKIKEVYKKWGMDPKLTEGDELFYTVELPKGWKKEQSGGSYWSDLLDDKGRVRAHIFYKAAFYDRHSHISFVSLYSINKIYPDYEEMNSQEDFHERCNLEKYQWEIKKGTEDFYRSKIREFKRIYKKEEHYEWHNEMEKVDRSGQIECENWLKERLPNWKDIHAYWES